MAEHTSISGLDEPDPVESITDRKKKTPADLPWWLFAIILIAILTAYLIYTKPNYNEAFNFIKAGLRVPITTSLISYAIAMILGLFADLGHISKNVVINNIARLYVEFIRGVPMLVLIFFIALVGVPIAIDAINGLGIWLSEKGLIGIGNAFLVINTQNVSMNARAITALSFTYGAFLAEIFRAGIQSIGRGQIEVSRSLGVSYAQAVRYVILPQAVRNVLPALGNDFVAMVKDSSLISVLAVRDITQLAKVYTGRTFRFREAYVTLSVLYLTMTVSLSLLVQMFERRLRKNE
jgi:polar amino acid transport system permease protein